jgi:hypothetical protein
MKDNPGYNDSSYNMKIEWENTEITLEALSVIAIDDPSTCEKYTERHKVLDTPGWKRLAD